MTLNGGRTGMSFAVSEGMFGMGLAGLHCSLGMWDKGSNSGLF